MTVRVFKLVNTISRSVYYAQCVKEVQVDRLPRNLNRFAQRHGGHFAQVDKRKVVA